MTIRELRILPPLAIARLGASDLPVDNYEVEVDATDPLRYRRLRPAETFQIDDHSGEIKASYVPTVLRFMDNGKVRPGAPFPEVLALFRRRAVQPLTAEPLR